MAEVITSPPSREVRPSSKGGMDSPGYIWARVINIVLGVWLFISAFVWQHSQAQFTNTWILGVICVGLALIALAVPYIRYLNTILAVWLFISAFALPTMEVGTVWNNALVAIAIFIVSLVPAVAAGSMEFPRRRVTV